MASAATTISRDMMGYLRAASMKVHVWTVNEPVQMLRFISLGVDNIITDVPDVLIEVLADVRELSTVETTSPGVPQSPHVADRAGDLRDHPTQDSGVCVAPGVRPVSVR